MLIELLFLLAIPCLSHKRFFYPWPRDMTTAPRSEPPCGGVSFEEAYAQGRITNWNAGDTVEIIIYEEIYHGGQPLRLAISSQNNEDFDSCIWLNHIPQHNRGDTPGGRNLSITLTVPDMTCKNCTLQLIGLQTEGSTDTECCAYTNNDTKTCSINQYYSCANININGGKRGRSDVCVQPSNWPYRSLACNYYKDERSTTAWEVKNNDVKTLYLKTNGKIENVPNTGTFCKESNIPIRKNNACQKQATNFKAVSLLEGGDMQVDGIIAIIVVFILVIAIVATYFISKKRQEKINVADASHSTMQRQVK